MRVLHTLGYVPPSCYQESHYFPIKSDKSHLLNLVIVMESATKKNKFKFNSNLSNFKTSQAINNSLDLMCFVSRKVSRTKTFSM